MGYTVPLAALCIPGVPIPGGLFEPIALSAPTAHPVLAQLLDQAEAGALAALGESPGVAAPAAALPTAALVHA